jgi:predicted Zn-dependent protease
MLLAGIASPSRYAQAERVFAESIRSFAPLDAAEAARVRPNRLGFTTVRSGETWQAIAERSGGLVPASDLAVLNGFPANSQPGAGERIKIVIAGE